MINVLTVAFVVLSSVLMISHACQDVNPELCAAIATANLCDHSGLALETQQSCRRSCGNCTGSNTIWICYWEDDNGKPAATCSSMANATLCEPFDLDESDCIAIGAKGSFRSPTRLRLRRDASQSSGLPVVSYSLHSDASCLFNYAFQDIVQGAAEEGKCHHVTTPAPTDEFAPVAIFDNCETVDGIWQCTIDSASCYHWTSQKQATCPSFCRWDDITKRCYPNNTRPWCPNYPAPECGGPGSHCIFEPYIQTCVPKEPCACADDGVSNGVLTGHLGCGIGNASTDFEGDLGCYVNGGADVIDLCGCMSPSTMYPGAAYRRCAPSCQALLPSYDRPVLESLGLQPVDFEVLDIVLQPYTAALMDNFPVGCRPLAVYYHELFGVANRFYISDTSLAAVPRGDNFDATWRAVHAAAILTQPGDGLVGNTKDFAEFNLIPSGAGVSTVPLVTESIASEAAQKKWPAYWTFLWASFNSNPTVNLTIIPMNLECSDTPLCPGSANATFQSPNITQVPLDQLPFNFLAAPNLPVVGQIAVQTVQLTSLAVLRGDSVTMTWIPTVPALTKYRVSNRTYRVLCNMSPLGELAAGVQRESTTPPVVNDVSGTSTVLRGLPAFSVIYCYLVEITAGCLPRQGQPTVLMTESAAVTDSVTLLTGTPTQSPGCINLTFVPLPRTAWNGPALGYQVHFHPPDVSEHLEIDVLLPLPKVVFTASDARAVVCGLLGGVSYEMSMQPSTSVNLGPLSNSLTVVATTAEPNTTFSGLDRTIVGNEVNVTWEPLDNSQFFGLVTSIEVALYREIQADRRRSSPPDVLVRLYPYLVDYELAESISLPFDNDATWAIVTVPNRTVSQAFFMRLANTAGLGPYSSPIVVPDVQGRNRSGPPSESESRSDTGPSLGLIAVPVVLVLFLIFVFGVLKSRGGEDGDELEAVYHEKLHDYEIEPEQLHLKEKQLGTSGYFNLLQGTIMKPDPSQSREVEFPVTAMLMQEHSTDSTTPENAREALVVLSEAVALLETDLHPNILELKAILLLERRVVCVEPIRGSLATILRKERPTADRGSSIPREQMVEIACEILDGMGHLFKQRIIHRNLKTDHIFMTWNGAIKIGHLRFAKRIPLEANSVTTDAQLDELNVRWQAPEVVIDNQFSVGSDIFSFGVILWEIFTFAAKPWGSLGSAEIAQLVEAQGAVLTQPVSCPSNIYKVMKSCWKPVAEVRPTPKLIIDRLDDILDTWETNATELQSRRVSQVLSIPEKPLPKLWSQTSSQSPRSSSQSLPRSPRPYSTVEPALDNLEPMQDARNSRGSGSRGEGIRPIRVEGWRPLSERAPLAHSGDYSAGEQFEHEAAFFNLMHSTDDGGLSPTEHLEQLLSNTAAQTSTI
eukprot:m.213965 g.213965  ORF g.213965 m.213965 type:complete len:1371 (+) comp17183_c0_seq4:189-4301(+)